MKWYVDLHYYAESKNELILRLIVLKDDKYKKRKNLNLGIIAIDLKDTEDMLLVYQSILQFINETEKSVS